jgi:thiol-disulfide isomerase/thioredoxin
MSFPIADISNRFASGRTFPEYFAHMAKNRDMVQAVINEVSLSAEDERYLWTLPGPVYVVAVSEDWCPDCAQHLPVLMKIAEASPQIQVRIVGRDDNLDLLAHALKGDRKAIPTFFFFDADWNEIGHWVERPVSLDLELSTWDHAHPAPTEPDHQAEVWLQYRMARSNHRNHLFFRDQAWRDTVTELRAILTRETFSNVVSLATA